MTYRIMLLVELTVISEILFDFINHYMSRSKWHQQTKKGPCTSFVHGL